MAEFTYIPEQTVAYGQSVIYNTTIPCTKGYIIHRNESGLVTLRGIVNNPCARFARYQVTFNGNIAIPDGGTVGAISLAIAIDGEPVLSSKAIVTPAATGDYFNVTSTALITVPAGCCFNVSVENTSDTSETITVQNSNLVATRVA